VDGGKEKKFCRMWGKVRLQAGGGGVKEGGLRMVGEKSAGVFGWQI